MQKNVQNRAVIFILTFVFALVLCGAASAATPTTAGSGFHKQMNNYQMNNFHPHYYMHCPPYINYY
ncbi:MAG: hypothetical protein K8E24_006210, partial [Methanobacterium paludis]|nr:hypothetical protein [Methanobacterium paludis]